MKIRPIKTKADYRMALKEIDRLFGAKPNTPEGDCLEIWATLVAAYEDQHFNIPRPDPVEAIQYHLESRGLSERDLDVFLGGLAKTRQILQRQRPLTMEMIRALHHGLGISADLLIQAYDLAQEAA